MSTPRILVISGSMGSGKTTIMGEASDLLTARGIRHAAVDLDAISLQLVPVPLAQAVQYRNVDAGHRRAAYCASRDDGRSIARARARESDRMSSSIDRGSWTPS